MNKLSGNKDVDMLILMKLDDGELVKVCAANKYINSICQDKNFWNMRIRILLNVKEDELHELRRYLHMDGKELYVYLVSKGRIGWNYTALLIIFLLRYQDLVNQIIDESLKILPKYINREELVYYLRGIIPKMILEDRIINKNYAPHNEFFTSNLKLPYLSDEMIPYPTEITLFVDNYIKENIRKF